MPPHLGPSHHPAPTTADIVPLELGDGHPVATTRVLGGNAGENVGRYPPHGAGLREAAGRGGGVEDGGGVPRGVLLPVAEGWEWRGRVGGVDAAGGGDLPQTVGGGAEAVVAE